VHHAVGEGPDADPVRLGHPHQFGDDVHWKLSREVVDVVELIRLQRGVQVLYGDLGDPRFELANSPGGEPLRHQRPQPKVPGIVERQERHHPVRVFVARDRVERDAVLVRQGGAVAKTLDDVRMPGQGPELLVGVAVQRCLVAQPAVVGVRVLVEVVVVGVQEDVRRAGGHGCSPKMRPTT
jgi:hypothetical protein